MGIYNCAPTLAEALDSLLCQTYQGFKVIMCDDGSSDNTAEVAQAYVDKYPDKFILIRNDHNMGLNYTLNHCLEYADTEYVARMDGDDISLPDRFEKEVDFLDKHPQFAIVSGPMNYFDDEGVFRSGRGKGVVVKENFIYGTPFCHAPCMVRKEAYDAVDGYTVSDKLIRVEDYHLWFKMYLAGYKGYNLEMPIYSMRDDRNAKKRRHFRGYLNEARLRSWGFRKLGLPLYAQVFALRPLLVAILPFFVYDKLHKLKR
ncbi:glycosyltransferase [uncultured Muribaculum sp.]|uniref:glycosyltransferase n=1 Tax=uncultured Muribaculum sp. TaxID=1918613 RepID=UPI00351FFAEB